MRFNCYCPSERMRYASAAAVCVVHKGLDGSLDGLAGANALQHVPPLGTCGCPARSDLVVVAQIAMNLLYSLMISLSA